MTIVRQKYNQLKTFNKKTIIKIPYKHNHCLDTSQIHFHLRDLLTMEEKHMHVACTNPSLPHKKDSVDVCMCAYVQPHMRYLFRLICISKKVSYQQHVWSHASYLKSASALIDHGGSQTYSLNPTCSPIGLFHIAQGVSVIFLP
jgi:hypothetical protein